MALTNGPGSNRLLCKGTKKEKEKKTEVPWTEHREPLPLFNSHNLQHGAAGIIHPPPHGDPPSTTTSFLAYGNPSLTVVLK